MLADFWSHRREVNARRAIFHQWAQLEKSGCIHNFRLAAGEAEGFREGWFFADSDAYKWLEAACRILGSSPDDELAQLVDDLIDLIRRAQCPDGYIFTYSQLHFPAIRWRNLQIEHELYCHGHLIEAGVTRFETTGEIDLLEIARKAADRVVADFRGKGPAYTPGHEEIEIALLRLHRVTPGDTAYLEMARQFLEQRGRAGGFALSILRQNISVGERTKAVQKANQAYLLAHPDHQAYPLPPGNEARHPPNTTARWYASALSGKYFQQHAPIREQKVPVGHSVRFTYLETATAMLAGITGDKTLLPALEKAWDHMVSRRMYVTGGIGSLPGMEGFGNDYELDPEFAYAETCAALGSMFWNHEMAKLTGKPQYSDLFEWQLYNASAVGMGLDGTTYLYNNPLACSGGVTRQPWYAIPCCSSNLSRTWANLDRYVFSISPGELVLQQYVSCPARVIEMPAADGGSLAIRLQMESRLPWEGYTKIQILDVHPQNAEQHTINLQFRLPSWAAKPQLSLNGRELSLNSISPNALEPTASGYDPRGAAFLSIDSPIGSGDEIEIRFEMPIRILRAHPKVKGHAGKAAITRGPLVYCLENLDNPGVDIFNVQVDPSSLQAEITPDLLEGIVQINCRSVDGLPLTLIPYMLWGNRGKSQMTVWIRTGKEA